MSRSVRIRKYVGQVFSTIRKKKGDHEIAYNVLLNTIPYGFHFKIRALLTKTMKSDNDNRSV